MLWAGGFMFDVRHRNSDLARQSARRKGEAKVGKGGKGEFWEAELVLDMCLSSCRILQYCCFGVVFEMLFSLFGVCRLFVLCFVFCSGIVFSCLFCCRSLIRKQLFV